MITKNATIKLDSKTVDLSFKAIFPTDDDGCTPRFSLTYSRIERTPRGRLLSESYGVADERTVQRHAPELLDVLALHLSDEAGAPMHAEASALYWAAGAVQGSMGMEYHGGNSQFVKKPHECIAILASHLRISVANAENLINHVDMVRRDGPVFYENQKAVIKNFVQSQRSRWAAEAIACMTAHNQGADR